MASQRGACRESCNFDSVDIDCSMELRMVHEREKKILGKSIKGRNSDGTVFRGLIKFENAVSGTVDSQHRPSKTLSSILSQHPSSNRSSSPQSSLSYSSATPLLPEQNSVAPKLEEWSLQVSSRLVSTPLAPPDGTGENISRPAGHTYASPTLHLSKGLTSTELRNINASAVSFHPDQTERELRFKPKANTSAFSTGARDFCSNGRAAFGSVGPRSAAQLTHNQSSETGAEKEPSQSSSSHFEVTSTYFGGQNLSALISHPALDLASREPLSSLVEQPGVLVNIIHLPSYRSLSSMASESGERPAQKATGGRRTDTPPRSIFDDYQSAYQSILSSARTFTETSRAPDAENTPEGASRLSSPNNPFGDWSPHADISRQSPHGMNVGFVAAPKCRRISRQPSSPKSKRKTNFSRPMSDLPGSDQAAGPASAALRDLVSTSNLDSLRRLSDDRSLNIKQPNRHGARGRVEKSSTIESIVKRYGNESPSARSSNVDGQEVEGRSSLDIMGIGQGMSGRHSINPGSCPAGQPPNVPLPPVPSYVAARGLSGETLSEASLYENTEKLLNLTQTNEVGTLAESTNPGLPGQVSDGQGSRLNSEFCWVGTRGKTSFRDMSTKELKQLRRPTDDQPGDVVDKVVDMPQSDESYGGHYLLTDAVYHAPTAEQTLTELDEIAKEDAYRAELLSEHLATHPSEGGSSGYGVADADGGNLEGGARDTGDPHADSAIGIGGFQSCSSRGVSLDVPLRGEALRAGIYMDERSLASLVGRESGDDARWDTLAEVKEVNRSVEDCVEEDLSAEAGEGEDGEWETVGESWMRSKLETQASIGRDTSGSSLANVSSKASTEIDRSSAPLPWDPLRSHPALITPPTKAVINQRSGYIHGIPEPLTVPRYECPVAEGHQGRTLDRTSFSTPALTFSANPQYQRGRERSPTYRHPTPLKGEHQNPFISAPPSMDVPDSGVSFELSELKDKRNDKHQTICADPPRRLHQHIHDSSHPEETGGHSKDSFTELDTGSNKSADGSYSTTYPSNLVAEGSSILNLNSPHTPKSVKSFTRGSIKRTKSYFTGSPKTDMSESRRYQRLREEMGCGTGGIVRVPGMQRVAPPSAHIAEELIGPTKPYRAANPLPDLPPQNSFGLTFNEPLSRSSTDEQIAHRMTMANDDMNILRKKCPSFPLSDQMLQTFFRNSDGSVSDRPKAKRGTVLERDGRIFEQAYCELHSRWEFSHTPHLTRRTPKDDVKIQREMGRRLILILFLSIIGWLPLIFMVAFDPGDVRDDLIREYTKGAVWTFHHNEIVIARQATVLIVAIIAVALTLVGLKLE